MAVVAFSPARLALQDELRPFERVAISLSSSLTTLQPENTVEVVSDALEAVGIAFGVDECTLISFAEPGRVKVVGSWAVHSHAPCSNEDVARMPWLTERLAGNLVVATTDEIEAPLVAANERAPAEPSGVTARLAVPVASEGRVVFGLLVGSRQRHSEWRTAFVDRLRLVAEILGRGLERRPSHDGRSTSDQEAARLGSGSRADALSLQDQARNQTEADQIVGDSAPLRLAMTRMAQVAPLDATVLLLGETGTGKELFARALHERSRRRRRTFIRVNCAALPPSLIESELFGHERGAFTGAVSMRQGRFELADGGTIFLDEIGDLGPELQAKLLRVLQEGDFERVGSSKSRHVDVRIIAATHHDLENGMAEGRFRADLYYRLSVFPIHLPPLRDRPEDIPQLVKFIIHRRQRDLGRRITRVPATVMQALQRHDWPGNVRELENVIERAMIRSTDSTLQLDDPLRTADVRRPPSQQSGDSLDAVQRYHIEKVLRACGWRINGAGNAAVRLGIHPNTLRFRMKKLGVVKPGRRAPTTTPPSAGRRG